MSQQQLYIRDIAMFEITNGPRPLNATAPRNPVIPARTVVQADTKATVATAAARICSCLEPISPEAQLTLSAIIPWKTVLHKSFRSQCRQFPRKPLHLVSHAGGCRDSRDKSRTLRSLHFQRLPQSVCKTCHCHPHQQPGGSCRGGGQGRVRGI